jgi:hypothetical protein
MLNAFVLQVDQEGDFHDFQTSNFTESMSLDDVRRQAARAVSTILALTMTDAVSRSALMSNPGLVTHDNGNGTVEWQGLWLQSSGGNRETETWEAEELEGRYVIHWETERHGWGYGFRTPTMIAGVIIMMLHAVVVVLFSVYVLWFRVRGTGWASTAWGGLGEILALALASRKPRNEALVRRIASSDDKWNDSRTLVTVRTFDHMGVELVMDDGMGALEDPNRSGSRLTLGRSYSN